MTRLTRYFESEETDCLLDAVESDDFPVLAQFAAESYHETYVENLHTAIKRTIFAVDNTSSTSLGGVCFESGQGKEIGSTKTVIPAECKGKSTLVLNPAHLTSMLKTLDSDSMLTFVLNGSTPIGMTADNHSYQYFVMPVSNADIPYQVEVNGIDIGKMIEQRKAEELVAMVEVVKTGSDNPAEESEADEPPTDESEDDDTEYGDEPDEEEAEYEDEESDEEEEPSEDEPEDIDESECEDEDEPVVDEVEKTVSRTKIETWAKKGVPQASTPATTSMSNSKASPAKQKPPKDNEAALSKRKQFAFME